MPDTQPQNPVIHWIATNLPWMLPLLGLFTSAVRTHTNIQRVATEHEDLKKIVGDIPVMKNDIAWIKDYLERDNRK